jgi:hypothetical protein
MPETVISQILDFLADFFRAIVNLSKSGIFEELKKLYSQLFRRWRNEGLYQVLDYETTLELMDARGYRASVLKREKIRYLQNNTVAFQDQAWGDGKILVDYECSPGVPVDRYRSGFKTHILISLREVKSKDDIDEFCIRWKILKGFLKKDGFWSTEISHDTLHIKNQVIFPKTRLPKRMAVLEKNRQRTLILGSEAFSQLPDGRCVVTWEKTNPDLYEHYVMSWVW